MTLPQINDGSARSVVVVATPLMEFRLEGAQHTATHAVQSSLTNLPQIVERQSVCGTLKMHAPADLPSAIRLDIVPVNEHSQHSQQPPPELDASHHMVMQGEIIRLDDNGVMISHGGLLLKCGRRPAQLLGGASVGQLVRTIIAF